MLLELARLLPAAGEQPLIGLAVVLRDADRLDVGRFSQRRV